MTLARSKQTSTSGGSSDSEVTALAARWNQILISGGDRHGIEPNANLNLTRAASFTAFVHEVRRERQSHVLFMPQYAEPWKHRILNSTLAAVRDYPEFPEGSQCWDERVFHPDAEGKLRPLAELWFRDRTLDIHVQRHGPLTPQELAQTDYIFTFDNGKLVQLK